MTDIKQNVKKLKSSPIGRDSKNNLYATVSELSCLMERTPQALYRQINKAGLKANKAGKYSIEKVKILIEEANARDNRNTNPDNPKSRKTELECKILEAKLNQIKGETISKAEHISIILQSHSIIKQQLVKTVKEISQITSNIEAQQEVKKVIENICNTLSKTFGETELSDLKKGKDDAR